jgi:hypothetical protein
MEPESIFAKVMRLAREKRESMPEHRAFSCVGELKVPELSDKLLMMEEKKQ